MSNLRKALEEAIDAALAEPALGGGPGADGGAPEPYYPTIVAYPEAQRVEFVLRDTVAIYDHGPDYDTIRDTSGEVIGFSWPLGTNPAVAPGRYQEAALAEPAPGGEPVSDRALIVARTINPEVSENAETDGDTVDRSTYTFSGLSFGEAHATRRIVAALYRHPAEREGGWNAAIEAAAAVAEQGHFSGVEAGRAIRALARPAGGRP